MNLSPFRTWLGVFLLAGGVAACTDISTPTGLRPGEQPSFSSLDNVTLLDCPATADSTATATIGTTGGALQLNGHRMDVPKGALKGQKDFRAHVQSSRYLEVDFSADGHASYKFDKPVQLTLDYSRCTDSNLNLDTEVLRVYHIDPVTKEILEDMGGVDDKTGRTVKAPTDHLSDYALGSPN